MGVLYKITEPDFKRLCHSEGAAYRRVLLDNIECEGRLFRGCTFVSGKFCTGRKPSRRYLQKLIQGAKENNLPKSYIADLSNIKTIHIPIVSLLVDLLGALALKYTASGRRLNLIIVRFGAVSDESDPDS
jgi:hypothetical protein